MITLVDGPHTNPQMYSCARLNPHLVIDDGYGHERIEYAVGFDPPNYPVPAIAYDFTDVINGECVMLTYRNRSDVKAPWRVAYEYPPYIE